MLKYSENYGIVKLHFAQSSVYALIGTERLRELHAGGQGYELYYDKLDMEVEPTQADIFWQLS